MAKNRTSWTGGPASPIEEIAPTTPRNATRAKGLPAETVQFFAHYRSCTKGSADALGLGIWRICHSRKGKHIRLIACRYLSVVLERLRVGTICSPRERSSFRWTLNFDRIFSWALPSSDLSRRNYVVSRNPGCQKIGPILDMIDEEGSWLMSHCEPENLTKRISLCANCGLNFVPTKKHEIEVVSLRTD
jgi:hypothetical protein